MYTYNVTFMVEHADEPLFLDWLSGEARPLLNADGTAGSALRLSVVADVPGDPGFASNARSFALQTDFPTMAAARRWAEMALYPVLEKYTARFGAEKALCFATILQKVDF